MQASQEVIKDSVELSDDEIQRIGDHLQTQVNFCLLKRAARDQLGFNPDIVARRMMMMSRPQEDSIYFKDCISRLSLILDRHSELVCMPVNQIEDWNSVRFEFSKEIDGFDSTFDTQESLRNKLKATSWYIKEKEALIELVRQNKRKSQFQSWTSCLDEYIGANCPEVALQEMLQAVESDSQGYIDGLNRLNLCVVLWSCICDALDELQEWQFRSHPLYEEGLGWATKYTTAQSNEEKAIATIKLEDVAEHMRKCATYNRNSSAFWMLLRQADESLSDAQ